MTLSPQVSTSTMAKRKALALELLWTILRTIGLVLLISVILSRSPKEQNLQSVGVIFGMVVLALIYVVFFMRSIRAVQKSHFPGIRAGEALVSSGFLLLAIFASIYSLISLQDPEAFTEVLTPFSSMYFSLTILATVGFGDIAPTTVAARSVAMAQMVLDLVFIGVLVRTLTNAAKRSIASRSTSHQSAD
jgi:voltage-gated potassium channel